MFNLHYNEAVLSRIKAVFNAANDKEFTEKINIVTSEIVELRKCNNIPSEKLVKVIVATNGEISLDLGFGNTKLYGEAQ